LSKKIISGVRPTRIELLKLRKREILARKGHDLLEEKRDAMVMEFFRMIDEYWERQEQLERDLERAYEQLLEAQMVMGYASVGEISHAVPEMAEITMELRPIMGVKVPVIKEPETLRGTAERGYSYVSTSAAFDEAADSFESVMKHVLRVAETETAIRKLAQEIERTKRRVNALENILIPRLHETQKYIEMHLEELEREDIFRRKRTKERKVEVEVEA